MHLYDVTLLGLPLVCFWACVQYILPLVLRISSKCGGGIQLWKTPRSLFKANVSVTDCMPLMLASKTKQAVHSIASCWSPVSGYWLISIWCMRKRHMPVFLQFFGQVMWILAWSNPKFTGMNPVPLPIYYETSGAMTVADKVFVFGHLCL